MAYDRLADEVRAWFARLTSDAALQVQVAYTRCSEPYADVHELRASLRCSRLLEIHSAAYDRQRRHPLLDSSVGGTFDQLRAVHDLVSHGWKGLGFDRDDEYTAWRMEEAMYSPAARPALATELHAQHSVLWTSGQLAELKATVLAADVLDAARRARPLPLPHHHPARSQR
jgi:hypothetical protein